MHNGKHNFLISPRFTSQNIVGLFFISLFSRTLFSDIIANKKFGILAAKFMVNIVSR